MFPMIPRVNNNYLFHMFPRLAIIYAFYYFHSKQHLFLLLMIHRANIIYFHKPSYILIEMEIFD